MEVNLPIEAGRYEVKVHVNAGVGPPAACEVIWKEQGDRRAVFTYKKDCSLVRLAGDTPPPEVLSALQPHAKYLSDLWHHYNGGFPCVEED